MRYSRLLGRVVLAMVVLIIAFSSMPAGATSYEVIKTINVGLIGNSFTLPLLTVDNSSRYAYLSRPGSWNVAVVYLDMWVSC